MRPPVASLPLALSLALPAAGQDDLQARVGEALGRARTALLKHLPRLHGGMLALGCLAAVHEEVPPGDKTFARAIELLSRAELESTYELAIRLMVMSEFPDFPDRDAVADRDTKLLLERQTTGGFSYNPNDGWWDLSNTQYAALGLRAAVSLGQEVPTQRWRLLYHAILDAQTEDGGFSYRPGQGRTSAYSSMTVAGIAVLEICRQHLELDELADKAVQERIDRAWQWLAANVHEVGSLRTKHTFYFHYGLERAAILSDVKTVGEVDWYAAGAEMLLKYQKKSGGWRWDRDTFRPPYPGSRYGHPVDTSFAILFLRRKFQRVLAPVTGVRGARSATLAADSPDASVEAAAEADTRAGRAIVAELLKCLRSSVLPQRKAATLALFRITGKDFGLQPYRTPEENAAAIHEAEKWWLANRDPARGGGR